jgi:hypothetical protein
MYVMIVLKDEYVRVKKRKKNARRMVWVRVDEWDLEGSIFVLFTEELSCVF